MFVLVTPGIAFITQLAMKLIKRFHVAVGPFSNRSQMTSKWGKNKKVAHEAQPSVTDDLLRRVLTIINRPLQAHHASLCIIEECLH